MRLRIQNERGGHKNKPVEAPETVEAIDQLLSVMNDEFDSSHKDGRTRPSKRAECYKKRAERVAQKLAEAEEELERDRDSKSGQRLQTIWIVRAGLASPLVPLRAAAAFLNDFPWKERKSVHYSSVAKYRDAFCEIIKDLNMEQCSFIAEALAASGLGDDESTPLVLLHIHDEVRMRLRSVDLVKDKRPRSSAGRASVGGATVTPKLGAGPLKNPHPFRCRYTKIQNQVMELIGAGRIVEILNELTPLASKDGPTIATAIVLPVERVVRAIEKGLKGNDRVKTVRLIHIVVGDGIPTNENAVKRAYPILKKLCADLGIHYSLIPLVCASHMGNLLVQVAICGKIEKKPEEASFLCGTLVRLFKYVLPDYTEELSKGLSNQVLRMLRVVRPADAAAVPDGGDVLLAAKLQKLYGKDVLPDEVVELVNGPLRPGELNYVGNRDRRQVARDLEEALYRKVIKVEERPQVTRFWAFTECCNVLLMCFILGIDSSWLETQTLVPRPEAKKRIERIRAYWDRLASPAELRAACLCLRLTILCTNITAKKSSGDDTPTLVRLGKCEVQAETCRTLVEVLENLELDPVLNRSATMLGLFKVASLLPRVVRLCFR